MYRAASAGECGVYVLNGESRLRTLLMRAQSVARALERAVARGDVAAASAEAVRLLAILATIKKLGGS
jgi:hypothetical protein